MSDKQSQTPQPPKPPELERKMLFYPYQLIAIPLLLLIPVLALFGVFGETMATAAASQNGIELEVDYPTRMLYHSDQTIEVQVRNTTGSALPLVTVTLDVSYLNGFSDLSFVPSNVVISDDVYRINFENVQAGETRILTIDTVSVEYGSHQGTISVTAGANGPSVTVSTFIIP